MILKVLAWFKKSWLERKLSSSLEEMTFLFKGLKRSQVEGKRKIQNLLISQIPEYLFRNFLERVEKVSTMNCGFKIKKVYQSRFLRAKISQLQKINHTKIINTWKLFSLKWEFKTKVPLIVRHFKTLFKLYWSNIVDKLKIAETPIPQVSSKTARLKSLHALSSIITINY